MTAASMWFVLAFLLLLVGRAALAAESLRSYAVQLDETSVSGISSGAYMAVQFGVAHAAIVRGVGTTAGGPFYCAGDEVPSLLGTLGNVIARCMQGDPKYPAQAIDAQQIQRMVESADEWARSGKIDATDHLARQRVWIFHGYNDGIVKARVTDALYAFYAHYVDPAQIFYKDNLKAGHAQITDRCAAADAACNRCERTGGTFMNQCPVSAAGSTAYDAAGSMLQHIYGMLQSKNTGPPRGRIIRFSQREFVRDGRGAAAAPIRIAMDDVGYLYVPDACRRGELCRVHVAFHGCQQSASQIKDAFYRYAGYNEWADTNHLLILYPQARPTSVPVIGPLNPQGCWDWWGYNDIFDSAGRYATREGLQIAAVRRMVDRLARSGSAPVATEPAAIATGVPPNVAVGDFTHRQVELHWDAAQASGYNVYRSLHAGGPYGEGQRVNSGVVTIATFVDRELDPETRYFYVVRTVNSSGREGDSSNEISVLTAPAPPDCDPYYSLEADRPVTRDGKPTNLTCS